MEYVLNIKIAMKEALGGINCQDITLDKLKADKYAT